MNKVVGEIEMNRYSPQELWAELRDFTVENCVQVQYPLVSRAFRRGALAWRRRGDESGYGIMFT